MVSLFIQGKQIFDKYSKDEVTVYAAQASFFIVISFFPFIMLLLTLVRFIPGINQSDLQSILVGILPDMLDSLVFGIVDDLYTKSTGALISITALTALWSASRGMLSIERSLNRVYEVREKRNYILSRLICAGYTVVFIITCVASLLLLVLGTTIQNFIYRTFPVVADIPRYIISFRSLLALAILIFAFVGLYTFLPGKKQPVWKQLPGAIFSTVGWMIFSALFSLYFEHYNNYENYSYMYGSLAAMVLLMLWLYICICILLIGAEMNYYYAKNRSW